jgi:hypothetical protein
MAEKSSNLWRWRNRKNCNEQEGPLRVIYEVNLSTVSDDYLPEETSAEELLQIWIKYALKKYPEGYVSISWFVESKHAGMFEGMPFQHDRDRHNFLTHFTWPVHAETGDEIDWLSLPVDDLHWLEGRGDKGGFIQEATGWKPSMLQPGVHLAMFRAARRVR